MTLLEWIKDNSGDVSKSAAVAVAAIALERVITRTLHRLQATGSLPPLHARLMRRGVQWLAVLLVCLTIFSIFGGGATRLWTHLSAVLAVIGIGFVAQWSSLSNVIAGFIILVWRPFRLGERVELMPDGPAGRVDDINTMFTTLRADDGCRFAVPNNHFLQRAMKCGTPAPGTPAPGDSPPMGSNQ